MRNVAALRAFDLIALTAACIAASIGLLRGVETGRRLALADAMIPASGQSGRLHPDGQPTEFYLPGCTACEIAAPILDSHEDATVQFRRIDVSSPDGDASLTEYLRAYRIPRSRPVSIPLVFIGRRYLTGSDEISRRLGEAVAAWKKDPEAPSPAPIVGSAQAEPVDRGGDRTAASVFGDLPAFRLIGPTGEVRTGRDLAGKPAMLIFLCGCDRCHRFAKAWDAMKLPSGVTVWGISGFSRLGEGLWDGARPAFPMLYDANQVLSKQLSAGDCPQVRLFDRSGRIAWSGGGATVSPEALAREAARQVLAMEMKR